MSASSIDFGGVLLGATTQPQLITLTNNGDVPLNFHGLTADGANPADFIGDPGSCGYTVDPHTSCQLGASFKPSATGTRSATLYVWDDAADSPQQISLTGTGQAPATATFTEFGFDFDARLVGTTSQPKLFTVTNNGDVPLSVAGVDAGGPNAGNFIPTLGTCTSPVAPHASCQLGASFRPIADGGHLAYLRVFDSAADSPQYLNVFGYGLATETAPLSASSLDFGGQLIGTASQSKLVTLTNNGDVPMDIWGLGLQGANPDDFSSDAGTCVGTVAPHASCQFGATFKPTAAGPRLATLLILDASGDSPQQISLAGTGATPLSITTGSPLTVATVGSPYRAVLSAAGGTAPYKWSLATGSVLPAGLTLHADGTIDGTPTTPGSINFTGQVADASTPMQTASLQRALTVKPAPPQADLKVSNSPVGSFFAGDYGLYAMKVTNTGNAATTGPITVTVSLPSGLGYGLAYGPGWTCRGSGQTSTCSHSGPLAPGASSQLWELVVVRARAGAALSTTVSISPTDRTPADNTAIDQVTVRRA